MSDITATIARALREARQARRLGQADVAEAAGLATEAYGRLERGEALPRADTLARLARALGTSADSLLGLGARDLAPLPAPEPPELRRVARRLRTLSPRSLRLLDQMLASIGHDAAMASRSKRSRLSRTRR